MGHYVPDIQAEPTMLVVAARVRGVERNGIVLCLLSRWGIVLIGVNWQYTNNSKDVRFIK